MAACKPQLDQLAPAGISANPAAPTTPASTTTTKH
jgi:hypothetical protein